MRIAGSVCRVAGREAGMRVTSREVAIGVVAILVGILVVLPASATRVAPMGRM
jgi:hypothetical protein